MKIFGDRDYFDNEMKVKQAPLLPLHFLLDQKVGDQNPIQNPAVLELVLRPHIH